jgi:hypothetical protein
MTITRPHRIPGVCFTMAPAVQSSALLLSGSLGGVCAILAVLTGLTWIAFGLLVSLAGWLLIYTKARTDMLIVGQSAVIVRQGLLGADTHIMALAGLRVHVHQGLIGRILNTGTVYLQDNQRSVRIAYLGEIDRLIALLVQRAGIARILLDYPGGRP